MVLLTGFCNFFCLLHNSPQTGPFKRRRQHSRGSRGWGVLWVTASAALTLTSSSPTVFWFLKITNKEITAEINTLTRGTKKKKKEKMLGKKKNNVKKI